VPTVSSTATRTATRTVTRRRRASAEQAQLTVAALRSYADSFTGRNGRSANDGEIHAVENRPGRVAGAQCAAAAPGVRGGHRRHDW
jgi:hypothetical protein